MAVPSSSRSSHGPSSGSAAPARTTQSGPRRSGGVVSGSPVMAGRNAARVVGRRGVPLAGDVEVPVVDAPGVGGHRRRTVPASGRARRPAAPNSAACPGRRWSGASARSPTGSGSCATSWRSSPSSSRTSPTPPTTPSAGAGVRDARRRPRPPRGRAPRRGHAPAPGEGRGRDRRARARPGRAARPARGRVASRAENASREIERNALGHTRRHRRGRGHHPPRPQGDPRGGGLRGRRRDGPGRRGRRARARARARPRHPRHQDAGPRRPGRRPRDRRRAPGRRADPHRLQPARPHRAGPRRRRARLPGQAVPAQRAGARGRGGARPLQGDAGPARPDGQPRGAARDPQGRRPGQGHADGRVTADESDGVRASSRSGPCPSGSRCGRSPSGSSTATSSPTA